jgi:hypothetical protein
MSHVILAVLAAADVLLIGSCESASNDAVSQVDLAPFQAMARAADCADKQNRLFLIDDRLVFWDREGSCPDMFYTFTLFDSTVENDLCSRADSIGGPNATVCSDESFRELFEAIVASRDEPDLGLGPGHRVQFVPL